MRRLRLIAAKSFLPGLPPAQLVLLWLALLGATSAFADEAYVNVLNQQFTNQISDPADQPATSAPPQLLESDHRVITPANHVTISRLDDAFKQQAQQQQEVKAEEPAPPAFSDFEIMLCLLLLLVGGLVVARRLALVLNEHHNPWARPRVLADADLVKSRAEAAAFDQFLTTFSLGPSFGLKYDADYLTNGQFAAELKQMRRQLEAVRFASTEAARHQHLLELKAGLTQLKGRTATPDLLPAWQMATALEGFVHQLAGKLSDITPSTLRTVAGGLGLLPRLSAADVRCDLLTSPPVRLLAVDDDLISRKAVALALKRALTPPDLAESGRAALPLAEKQAYDVIFLDVQMPEMDGFQLCTKLQETAANHSTPVVFVTCCDDFESRARSIEVGAVDFIAKPFLTFEITVKALTLTFEKRLGMLARADAGKAKLIYPTDNPRADLSANETAFIELSTHIAANLSSLRERAVGLVTRLHPAQQAEIFHDLYLLTHSLVASVARVRQPNGLELAEALRNYLQDLADHPAHRQPSAPATITTVLDLLTAIHFHPDNLNTDVAPPATPGASPAEVRLWEVIGKFSPQLAA